MLYQFIELDIQTKVSTNAHLIMHVVQLPESMLTFNGLSKKLPLMQKS